VTCSWCGAIVDEKKGEEEVKKRQKKGLKEKSGSL
jgi:hypothetical protein